MKKYGNAIYGLALVLLLASRGGSDAPVVGAKTSPAHGKTVIQGLTRQQTVRGEVQKFLQALGYSNQAGYLATQQPGLYSNPQLDKIVTLRRMALKTATSVDIEILDSISPGFGTHFCDEFIRGVSLFLAAVQSSSDEMLGRSREALNRWADWYDANRERIELAVNAE